MLYIKQAVVVVDVMAHNLNGDCGWQLSGRREWYSSSDNRTMHPHGNINSLYVTMYNGSLNVNTLIVYVQHPKIPSMAVISAILEIFLKFLKKKLPLWKWAL